jgi:hypothetical protein
MTVDQSTPPQKAVDVFPSPSRNLLRICEEAAENEEDVVVAACKHKWSGSITSAFWTQIICNYRRCRAQIDCERTQIICDGTANINQRMQIH